MDSLSFKKKFVHGLRWNSIESIIYYSILATHQIGLRAISTTNFYGAMGTLFALVFLTTAVFNFGFDFSIIPFFSIYSSSKQLFRSYLLKQIGVQIILYSFIASIMIFILANNVLQIKKMPSISLFLAIIISSLIISEGIKKSLRIILQLGFKSHITATIELFYIISYVSLVWGIYIFTGKISLYTIFLPMLTISLIANSFLLTVIYKFYKKIPAVSSSNRQISWKEIGYNRITNYGYQLTRELFTSNFLIPFFAMNFGLALAALLELVTALNQFITIIIKKIFGITGQALLSHVKNMHISAKRKVFDMASRNLYTVLIIVVSLIILTYKPIIALKAPQASADNTFLGLLFFILLFSENFILLYEKWFIIEEKTLYLIIFNGSLLALFWGLLQVPYLNSPLIILSALIVLRLIACIWLMLASFYAWQLRPPGLNKKFYIVYISLALLISYFYLFL